MFFVGIMGIETKQKELKDIPNLICKACGRMTSYKLVKEYMVFHLFFIPIFKWRETYSLISNCCGSIFELSKEQGKDIEEGRDYILENLDLTIEENKSCSKLICYNCGKELELKFEFCPYCGAKLK